MITTWRERERGRQGERETGRERDGGQGERSLTNTSNMVRLYLDGGIQLYT